MVYVDSFVIGFYVVCNGILIFLIIVSFIFELMKNVMGSKGIILIIVVGGEISVLKSVYS